MLKKIAVLQRVPTIHELQTIEPLDELNPSNAPPSLNCHYIVMYQQAQQFRRFAAAISKPILVTSVTRVVKVKVNESCTPTKEKTPWERLDMIDDVMSVMEIPL